VTIERASTAAAWAAAEALIREYAASLGVSLAFQHFEDEVANLARQYGPPDGVLLLARDSDGYVGCGALRRFSQDACEMKRLYVKPSAQGQGVGRALANALIDEARAIGYRRMLLDTLPSMHGAWTLYRSLGFREIAPYRFNPVPGTTFMELNLSDVTPVCGS
jgi:GNAT superfamily N-acetyltransferase